MEKYTLVVDEIKSNEPATEGKGLNYEEQKNLIATRVEIETIPPETKEIEKTTKRQQRLEEYRLGTAVPIIEKEIELGERIVEVVDEVLTLLESLRDKLSDPMEVESIFSNILRCHKILWGLRKVREKAYAEVLVLVESCIRHYDVTGITTGKIDVLKEIFGELKLAGLLSSYPKECRKKLLGVGFDIFNPIRGVSNKYILKIRE